LSPRVEKCKENKSPYGIFGRLNPFAHSSIKAMHFV